MRKSLAHPRPAIRENESNKFKMAFANESQFFNQDCRQPSEMLNQSADDQF
jgi:hypothetical protein